MPVAGAHPPEFADVWTRDGTTHPANPQAPDERIENESAHQGQNDTYFYYRFQGGQPVINVAGGTKRQLSRDKIDPELSILAQRRDPDQYPELTHLAAAYERIRLYREWT